MMTFSAFCFANKVTPGEREKLAWHLTMMRARHLYELLRA